MARDPENGQEDGRSASAIPLALLRRATATVSFERLWPWIVAALVTASGFVTLSWLGFWQAVPPSGRAAGVLIFAAAVTACLVAGAGAARVAPREALARLARDSGEPHRVATDLSDRLASPDADPAPRALWEAHRRRLAERASRLRLAPPAPRLEMRDRYAVRFAALLSLAVAALVAGPEREARLSAAFDWSGRVDVAAAPRLDGWINPPLYTRVPPMLLDIAKAEGGRLALRAPVRSEVVIRASDDEIVEVQSSGGLEKAPSTAQQPSVGEHRFVLTGDAAVTIRTRRSGRFTVALTAVPDLPPSVKLVEAPSTDAKGALTLSASVEDDYGVAAGEVAILGPVRPTGAGGVRAPLVPPPAMPLSLSGDARSGTADGRATEAKSSFDLKDHPWAGAEVEAQLVVRDDAGQEGRSEIFRMTLPKRPFTEPLAKALAEQRRDLVVDPAGRKRTQEALFALLIEPARFTPDLSVYLGLRKAARDLRRADKNPELLEVAEFLWQMALAIEEGTTSDAEKALRAAEQALRDALERGASPEELKRLMDELRMAMNRYMQELAEKMLRDPNMRQAEREASPNDRMLSQRDLDAMMDRMERMMRDGRTEEAQRMLDQLRNMMRDLKTARPMRDPRGREMQQALDELDRMTREQQQLRDDTFREGQRRRDEQRRNERGQSQRERQGQDGQQGRQGRQQGQEGQEGQGAESGEGRSPGQSLAERQQDLKRRLEEMRRRMQGMGGEPEGFGEAENEMGRAEGAIGRNQDGEAVDAQGRALENLRRGAQDMARRMQRQGNEFGEGEPSGEPNGEARDRADAGDPNRDPLGRDVPSREADDRARMQEGGKKGTLELRAREVLEELRRRLGETERPKGELDYLQRLIDPREMLPR